MKNQALSLRSRLGEAKITYMPAVYDPLGGRLAEALGVTVVYVGGYVTGASRAVSEPLLTMNEQVDTAQAVAQAITIPTVCDAGAGFGEPLHVTRTVREFARAGISGIHLEDQLYPKRAHYHRYVAHTVSAEAFGEKIRWACRERDQIDPDFVVIARSDACRAEGLPEAVDRVNRGADEGADFGLLFPRNDEEASAAPELARVPLLYVQSRGNRDGRPVLSLKRLEDMGYAGCIDAQLFMLASLHAARAALSAMVTTGEFHDLSEPQTVEVRQSIEDLIGLEDYYRIEEATVEGKEPG